MDTKIGVNWEKKKSELHPWTLILLLCGLHPSFMPALMLIWSFTKFIKLINSAVSSSQLVTELKWLSDGSHVQSWHKENGGNTTVGAETRAGTLLSAAATF